MAGRRNEKMGAQFLELLKKVTVFMLAGQLIVHFLPAGGYEKYVKMMISIMVLSQIVLPILSLGKFDAAGVYDSAMDKYEQEIEKIGMQVEALLCLLAYLCTFGELYMQGSFRHSRIKGKSAPVI